VLQDVTRYGDAVPSMPAARYSCRPRQPSNRPKRSSVRSIMVHAVPTSAWRIHIDGIVECRPLANSDSLGRGIGRPDELRDNVASITTPYGTSHVAARKRARRNVALHFCSQRQVLSTLGTL